MPAFSLFWLELPKTTKTTMTNNEQIVIDVEPANAGESARLWAKELRTALCDFLDEWAADNPSPVSVTIDVGPLTTYPRDD